MRNMYRILASQYDSIGYLTPFTARARVIIQELWKTKRGWDNVLETGEIRDQWQAWEDELRIEPLSSYDDATPPPTVSPTSVGCQLHVFCDASERVYGAVAYLRTENNDNNIHISFVMARSRVAPKHQLSIASVGALCCWAVAPTVRVAEIQTLTNVKMWRYVDTKNNPADDLPRGKTFLKLSQPSRWRDGPPFLKSTPVAQLIHQT